MPSHVAAPTLEGTRMASLKEIPFEGFQIPRVWHRQVKFCLSERTVWQNFSEADSGAPLVSEEPGGCGWALGVYGCGIWWKQTFASSELMSRTASAHVAACQVLLPCLCSGPSRRLEALLGRRMDLIHVFCSQQNPGTAPGPWQGLNSIC